MRIMGVKIYSWLSSQVPGVSSSGRGFQFSNDLTKKFFKRFAKTITILNGKMLKNNSLLPYFLGKSPQIIVNYSPKISARVIKRVIASTLANANHRE